MPHHMATDDTLEILPTHYQVLDLPLNVGPSSHLSAQHLKTAYRRALFQNHPDKIVTGLDPGDDLNFGQKSAQNGKYTIDQVTEAYTTLSIPKSRSKYDQSLKHTARTHKRPWRGDDDKFHSGLEMIDLDDLGYDEAGAVWFRSCRCGVERGYEIFEADLEEASDIGELDVGCKGCSLWLKVLFGVVEERSEDQLRNNV